MQYPSDGRNDAGSQKNAFARQGVEDERWQGDGGRELGSDLRHARLMKHALCSTPEQKGLQARACRHGYRCRQRRPGAHALAMPGHTCRHETDLGVAGTE